MKSKFLLFLILFILAGQVLLATAPVISNFSPTTGAVGSLVTISGTNLDNLTAFSIGGRPAITLSNTGTQLVGMVMPGSVTGAVALITTGGSTTSATNFTVTATFYPNNQTSKLVATDIAVSHGFGYSVALSADGTTAIVGAFIDNSRMGAAYIFIMSGGTWAQQAKLVGSNSIAPAFQGSSVAISADGNTVIIGGPSDNGNLGAAWVFTRNASVWTQQGELLASDSTPNAQQGTAVALSADGNTAVVGGPGDNGDAGAVWVYTRSLGVWTQQGTKLVGTGGVLARQGKTLALSADRSTLVVGGPADNNYLGAVWVFISSGGRWVQQGNKLFGTGGVGTTPPSQGTSVAVNADGNTFIEGGNDNAGIGAIWVFIRSGGVWAQQNSKLVGTGVTGTISIQGLSVSLSADGNTIIEAGTGDNRSLGATWVFTRNGDIWTQQGSKLLDAGFIGPENESTAVAISADGSTAIIGGVGDRTNGGAAFVFNYMPAVPATPTITAIAQLSGPIGTLVTVTGTNLQAPTLFSIAGRPAIVVSDNGTQLVGMVMPGAIVGPVSFTSSNGTVTFGLFAVTPTPHPGRQQGPKLTDASFPGTSLQGGAVAISADGNTAILGGSTDNGGIGAVWIYTRSGGVWVQQGPKLIANDNLGPAGMGYSVAINADGNTVIVGGYQDNGNQGASWIFTRNGNVWSQQGTKLVATDVTTPAKQGWSVAISADGNSALIGGYNDEDGIGAAWVYKRIGSIWHKVVKLVGNNNAGKSNQGASVALSADGNTAALGGSIDNNLQGAVWIFTQNHGDWSQQGPKLVATDYTGSGATQGISVALSADGNTLLSGGLRDNANNGAAWIFTRNGIDWTKQAKLVGTGNIGEAKQGSSVSVSADGNTAIVGGYFDNNGLGASWVYTRNAGTWNQQGGKLTGTGNIGGPEQGISVAVSADGSTGVIGGNFDNSHKGAAWVYIVQPAPTITSVNPTTGPVGTLVTVTGTNLDNPSAISINNTAALVVSNSETQVVFMVMPGTTNGFINIKTSGGLIANDQPFNVEPTLYPYKQQGEKLVGTGSIGTPQQGYSSAISADGNTAIIGGYNDNVNTGAAWIFKRVAGAWSQQGQKLVGSDITRFSSRGQSVAISADGNTAIVGGPTDNNHQGAAWIFKRTGDIWTQQGLRLVGNDHTGPAEQGASVAISADGNTVLVGGDHDGNQHGATWVFTRSNGTWSQDGPKLVGTGAIDLESQGKGVALSADGNTAVIGSPNDNFGAGAVWVFIRKNGFWEQQGEKNVASDHIGHSAFGFSVATNADGNYLIAGGPFDNNFKGGAWVFTRNGSIWSQQGSKISANDDAGRSVSISADGTTVMIGGENVVSAAAVFKRVQSAWIQMGTNLTGTGSIGTYGSDLGYSIALSADGTTGIAGGIADSNDVGAAWVYTISPPPTITSFNPSSGPVGTLVTITGTDFIDPQVTIAGLNAIVVNKSGTKITAMVMPGATTGQVIVTDDSGTAFGAGNFTVTSTPYPGIQQGPKLVGTAPLGTAKQGTSVAVSADGNTAIVGGPTDNNNHGAAWIYTRTLGSWTQQGLKLVGSDNAGPAKQGISVAISADGNTAIIGGFMDNNGIGAAWIFSRSNGIWTQQGTKLVPVDNTGPAAFGTSVAISADGNTAVIGGVNDQEGIGAAWIFKSAYRNWVQVGTKLVGSGYNGITNEGASVAISSDGNTAAVGGPTLNSLHGGVWIFTQSPGGWAQQSPVLTGGPASGTSVALSGDGNVVLFGGVPFGTNNGNVSIFNRIGGIWLYDAAITGMGSVGQSKQGGSVSLSADGTVALFSGYFDNNGTGATWVFTKTGGHWVQQGDKLLGAGNTGPANQGNAIALSSDGTTAITGGDLDNSNQGAVWAYIPDPRLSQTISFPFVSNNIYGEPDFDLGAVSTSGLPVTYTSNDINIALIVNNTKVHFVSAGVVTITASQAGNTTYKAANSITNQFSIGKANLTVTAHDTSLVAGQSIPLFAVTYSGFVNGDDVGKLTTPVKATTTATSQSQPGTYPITPSGGLSGNYNFTYVNGTLTIQSPIRTITFNALTAKTYGDPDFSAGAIASSGETIIYSGYDPAVITITNGTIHIVGAGTTTINATVPANPAYSNTPSQSLTLTINKADQTITFNTIPAQSSGTTYSLSGASASSGLPIAFSSSDLTVATISGLTLNSLHIGNAVITASQAGNANYNAAASVMETISISDVGGDEILPHQAVSPNGDGINDYWFIEGIQNYSDNRVIVFDRNGTVLFDVRGYLNGVICFDGHSTSGSLIPAGTYFYQILYTVGGINKHKTGFIELRY